MQCLRSKRIVNPFILALILSAAFVGVLVLEVGIGRAQTADELRQKIADSNKQLEAINAEIRKFEAQLNEVGAEKQTLQKALRELDIARKKMQSEIRATEAKIAATDLEIEELSREARIKELEITRDANAIAQSLRTVDELENIPLLASLLMHDSLAEVWAALEDQAALRDSLRKNIEGLKALKSAYERAKDTSVDKREELGTLKQELSGQHSSLEQTREQKDSLLSKTKNKESTYQEMLREKRAARAQFEAEMRNYEAQLQFVLNPATIPAAGSGVLRWPFEPTFMAGPCAGQSCITQTFGDTAFARSGAYNGKGHNGVDFGVPVGTRIMAALAGTVAGTGNTDAVSGCYSYGKWVLLRHANGLSTLYAHLSAIAVSPGQAVTTGQLIGNSGNTGYSTGPHLHFSVFASEGVKIQRLGDIPGRPITGCSPVAIPVAGFEAYLNPLQYL